MKTMNPDALAALEAGRAVVAGAVRFGTTEPLRLWGGYGTLEIDGEEYLPVGSNAIVNTTAGSVGLAAEGTTLELSDIPPENMAQINTLALRGVSVVIRRLIFDENGRDLLDDTVHIRGRVDFVQRSVQAGNTATIGVTVEGAARGLGRASGRMRTDADQRLILSTDGGMKHVSYAGEVTLYWGGKPPQRAGSVLPSSVGSGSRPNNEYAL